MTRPSTARIARTIILSIGATLLAGCTSGDDAEVCVHSGGGAGAGGGGASATGTRYHLYFADTLNGTTVRPRLVDPAAAASPLTIPGFASISEEFAPVVIGTLNVVEARLEDVLVEKIVYGVGNDVFEIGLDIGSNPPVPRSLVTLQAEAQTFLVAVDETVSPRVYLHVVGTTAGTFEMFSDVAGNVTATVPFPGDPVTSTIDVLTGAITGWLAVDTASGMLIQVDRNLTVTNLVPAMEATEIGRTPSGNVYLYLDDAFVCYHPNGTVTDINYVPSVMPLFEAKNFARVVGEDLFFCSANAAVSFEVVKARSDGTATPLGSTLMGVPGFFVGTDAHVVVHAIFGTQQVLSYAVDGSGETVLETGVASISFAALGNNAGVGDRVVFETMDRVVDIKADGTGRIEYLGARLRGFTPSNVLSFGGRPRNVEIMLLRALPSGAQALELAPIGVAGTPRRIGEFPLEFVEAFTMSILSRSGILTAISNLPSGTDSDIFVFDRAVPGSLERVTDSPGTLDIAVL